MLPADATMGGVASAPAAATARSVSWIWVRLTGSLRTASASRACSGDRVTDDGLATGFAAAGVAALVVAASAGPGIAPEKAIRTSRKTKTKDLRMGRKRNSVRDSAT